jgi:hypothetical protein
VSCRVLLLIVGCLSVWPCAPAVAAQPGASDRDFEDAFFVFETSELIDDVIKEGDRFNLPKELRDLEQKYERTFGRPISDRLLGDFAGRVREVWDTPPDARPLRKKQLPPDPGLYIAEERVRILSKTRREGKDFNFDKELARFAERYESKFGVPLPAELKDRYVQDVQSARALAATDSGNQPEPLRREPVSTKPAESGTAASSRQLRSLYRDGLPDWFRERDTDHDGQLGLYEWPRSQIDEFRRLDLNGDGFLVQPEVLRQLGVPAAPAAAAPQDSRRPLRR